MKIIVLGSGVVGVTTAWYLNQNGHDVSVFDRQSGPALETSFANAGQLSFGYSSPWAAPGIPIKALKWLVQKHAPLSVKPLLDWDEYAWLWQFLENCTPEQYAINKDRMERISEFSRKCLGELRETVHIDYEGRQGGTTQLFRNLHQLDAASRDMEVLDHYQVPYELLDRDGIVKVEPALARTMDKFVGALYLPLDETGDCRMFTTKLAQLSGERGVGFRYDTTIERIDFDGDRVVGVTTDSGVETADCYVVALGSYSRAVLAPLGLHLPVYPLKGFSLTLPVQDETCAPVSTVMDETYKIAITRFKDRIRVGGMAEIHGYDLSLKEKRHATLQMVVDDVFPGGGDAERATFWTGLRPATPDGTPVIGATPFRNLFLNTGHGTLGWTMSTGSASYLADLISGKTPPMDGKGLDIFRYDGAAPGHAAPVHTDT